MENLEKSDNYREVIGLQFKIRMLLLLLMHYYCYYYYYYVLMVSVF